MSASFPDSPELGPIIDDERAEHLRESRESILELASANDDLAWEILGLSYADELQFYHEAAAEQAEAAGNAALAKSHHRLARFAGQLGLEKLDFLDVTVFPDAA